MSSENIVVFGPTATILSVVDVADENGWPEVERFEQSEKQLEESVFLLPDGETTLRAINDHFVDVIIASVVGPAQDQVVSKLRARRDAVDAAVLWQWAESDVPAQRGFALRAFAATCDLVPDSKVMSLYERALKDPDPMVRKALVDAIGRTGWDSLWPLVEKLADTKDPDALGLQAAYQKHHPRSS